MLLSAYATMEVAALSISIEKSFVTNSDTLQDFRKKDNKISHKTNLQQEAKPCFCNTCHLVQLCTKNYFYFFIKLNYLKRLSLWILEQEIKETWFLFPLIFSPRINDIHGFGLCFYLFPLLLFMPLMKKIICTSCEDL